MSTPITWKSIIGPSLADASRPLAFAQQALTDAFTGLNKNVQDINVFNKDVFKKEDDAATQEALGKIYRANTVDQFKALNQSGVLDQQTAPNGAQIDMAKVNALRDGRMSTLQDRGVKEIQYNHAMLDEFQADTVRQINTLALKNPVAAQAMLDANPNLRQSYEIAKKIDASAQTKLEREQSATRFGWDKAAEDQNALLRPIQVQEANGKVKKLEDDLRTAAAQRASMDASANASNAQAALAQEHILGAQATRANLEAENTKALTLKRLGASLDGNIYKEGVFKANDTTQLYKEMKDADVGGTGKDAGDKRKKIIERLSELEASGITIKVKDANGKEVPTTVPLPLGLVRAAILGSGDKALSWNEGWADTFEENLRKRMEAISSRTENDKTVPFNQAADDYQNYLSIMKDSANTAPSVQLKTTKKGK